MMNHLGQDSPGVEFPSIEGSTIGDGEAHDGELEEIEESCPVSGW